MGLEEWHTLTSRPPRLAAQLSIAPGEWRIHVEEAAATYNTLLSDSGPGGVLRQFHRCVEAVREASADEPALRDELIAACQAVVEADGIVDPMEEHFMAQIARSWTAKAAPQTWQKAPSLDLLEAYIYVKRFLAEVADGHLHELEWADIQDQLVHRGAALGATASRCRAALEASSQRFRRLRAAGPDAVLVHFRECTDALHAALPTSDDGAPGLTGLIHELWELASADGIIDPGEVAILDDLERRWLSHL